ncbi:MAG TPA: hypothetical protein VFE60_19965 [Roseiarcus sp.]|jgi:hypothetical protein|nr:hypothetical protein [Roseiarcus sp.]
MYRLRSKPPRKVKKAEAKKAEDARQPAYLTQDPATYVDGVLDKQKVTVAALADAGMPEQAVRFYSEEAVRIAQQLPERIVAQRKRSDAAIAALAALNTVQAFVNHLYTTDARPRP